MTEETYPGALGIKKNPSLTGAAAAQEAKFAAYAESDPDGIVSRYLEAHKNRVDVDQARKLFPDYDVDRETRTKHSEAVHEPASAVAERAFQRILVRQGTHNKPVIFVIGGSASGKTWVIDQEIKSRAALVKDTQFSNFDSSKRRIEAALNSGHNVLIYYIARPPELAVVGMLDRAIDMGRVVPIHALAGSHASSQETIAQLVEEYKDDPRVRFYAVSNAGSDRDVKPIPISQVISQAPDDPVELEAGLREVLENERNRRAGTDSEIPEDIYRAVAKPGQSDLGKAGRRPGQEDDKQSQVASGQAAADQDGGREGLRPATAQASAIHQQAADRDASGNETASPAVRDKSPSPRASTVDAVHAGSATGAAQPHTQSAGREKRATSLGGQNGRKTISDQSLSSSPSASIPGGRGGDRAVGAQRDEAQAGSQQIVGAETATQQDAGAHLSGDPGQQPESGGNRLRNDSQRAAAPLPDSPTAADSQRAAAMAESSFRDYLATPQAVADYRRLFGKVISIDYAKELSPDYAASHDSRAELGGPLQEAAKEFCWRLYQDALKKPAVPPLMPLVVATMGGTGSGKTSTLRGLIGGDASADSSNRPNQGVTPGAASGKNTPASKLIAQAQIIWDNTWHSFPDAKKFIDLALAANKRVTFIVVYRDPVDAFTDGVVPRGTLQGRVVPLRHHTLTHAGVATTLPRLQEAYKGNPRVKFIVIDNSRGPGKAQPGDAVLYQKRYEEAA